MVHARGVVVRKDIIPGPELFRSLFGDLQERRPGAVAGGNENEVAYDQRRGGTDGSIDLRLPRILEVSLAGGGFQRSEEFASDEKEVGLLIDGSGNWRGIAGFVSAGLPQKFAHGGVE